MGLLLPHMGAVLLKRAVWVLLLAFTIMFIMAAPVAAAEVFKEAVGAASRWLSEAFDALLVFLASLID
jgi:hypothetical protein